MNAIEKWKRICNPKIPEDYELYMTENELKEVLGAMELISLWKLQVQIYGKPQKFDEEIYDELVKDGTIKIDSELEEFSKRTAIAARQTIDNIIKESIRI